jgi:hypothetical protein
MKDYGTIVFLAGSASAEFFADIALSPFEAVKVCVCVCVCVGGGEEVEPASVGAAHGYVSARTAMLMHMCCNLCEQRFVCVCVCVCVCVACCVWANWRLVEAGDVEAVERKGRVLRPKHACLGAGLHLCHMQP